MYDMIPLLTALALSGSPAGYLDRPLKPHEHTVATVLLEARGEPFDGRIAVAGVVLDRVKDPRWPGTEKRVIYQKRQFQPMKRGMVFPVRKFSVKDIRQARAAVLLAEIGVRPCGQVFWFHSAGMKRPAKWLTMRRVCRIAGHVFYADNG